MMATRSSLPQGKQEGTAKKGFGSPPLAAAADLVLRWGLLTAAIIVWEITARRAGSLFFPPPGAIVRAAADLWVSAGPPLLFTERVWVDVVPSLSRMFQGWSIAAVLGILVGVGIGRSRLLSDVTMPIVNFLRSTPGPALIPVFLVLFGTGSRMRVALIAFSSIWPVLLNTIDGVRSVDRTKLDAARVFSLPKIAVLRHVIIPASMPRILAGLRVAIAVALVLMVISELVASTHGLGHHLVSSMNMFRLEHMWAGIALLGLLGFALNAVFLRFERRMLLWHVRERRRK